MQHDRYLPRLIIPLVLCVRAPSLAQRNRSEKYFLVFISIFIFRLSSAFPQASTLPRVALARKHRTNKLPRTYPAFSLSPCTDPHLLPEPHYLFLSPFYPSALIRPFHPAPRFRSTRARLVRPSTRSTP